MTADDAEAGTLEGVCRGMTRLSRSSYLWDTGARKTPKRALQTKVLIREVLLASLLGKKCDGHRAGGGLPSPSGTPFFVRFGAETQARSSPALQGSTNVATPRFP